MMNTQVLTNGRHKEQDSVYLYAGGDRPSWIDYVPPSWRPYIQLTRINFAAPILLVYFPHFFGVLHTAILRRDACPPQHVVYVCVLLLGGSFFYSMAAHAWDDIVDVPIDRLIERTKKRPIVRGAITMRAALIFMTTQAVVAACFLPFLSPPATVSTVPAIVSCAYYPWAKRHTHGAQVVLGFCLAWGVMTGSASLGVQRPWDHGSRLCLLLACVIWTVIYDTIYAYIDVADDLRLGLKSTAVLFRNYLKVFLWFLLGCMGASLHFCGILSGMGLPYFLIAEAGSLLFVGLMIYKVDLSSTTSCYRWFSNGFWLPALFLATGLVGEYLIGL